MKFRWLLLSLLLGSPALLPAQHYIGLRFQSYMNYFSRPEELNLVESPFTTATFGVFYRQLKPNNGFEVGLQIVGKNQEGKGFGLPGVMADFSEDQNTFVTALEMDFKVGPRFQSLHPKIGYVLGYVLTAGGYQEPEEQEINKVYLHLPFGAGFDWKTRFGTVGVGAFYYIGLTNVLKNPDPDGTTGGIIYNGGRMRQLSAEITVSFGK